jgi:hypothetical protein
MLEFGNAFPEGDPEQVSYVPMRVAADGSFLKMDHPMISCSTVFICKIHLQAETRAGAALGSIFTPRKPSMFVFPPEIRTRVTATYECLPCATASDIIVFLPEGKVQ